MKTKRLQQLITAAGWWLVLTGLLHAIPGLDLGTRMGLRFLPAAELLAQQWGLSSLCLGIFLLRAARQAPQHPLAVDTLLLYFLAQAFLLLRQRVGYHELVWFEWLSLALGLACSTLLILFRSMHKSLAETSLLTAQATELPRLLKQQFKPAAEEPSKPSKAKAPAPAKRSAALPHMD